MNSPTIDPQQRSNAWPLAVTIIAIVAIIATAGYLVFRQVARIPADIAEQAKETMDAARDLALAFRQGTVETRFLSYVTSVDGSTFLQVATIDRIEVFTRQDRASIFWGSLQLPEVVVSAAAPVRYTAYVDLDEPWQLRLEDGTLRVVAPQIRFNRPAIDVSKIEFEVETGSLLRDEEAALAELKKELTSMSQLRTRELVPLIRETAREQVAGFVETWLLQSFRDVEDIRIEVTFTDRERPTSLLPQPSIAD